MKRKTRMNVIKGAVGAVIASLLVLNVWWPVAGSLLLGWVLFSTGSMWTRQVEHEEYNRAVVSQLVEAITNAAEKASPSATSEVPGAAGELALEPVNDKATATAETGGKTKA